MDERLLPLLFDPLEPELMLVLSDLETLASDAPEDLEPLSVDIEDEREEIPPPSRVEDEREFVPSLRETLRLVSVPLLRNVEFLLSTDELLPVETAERVPDERALLVA